MSTVMIKGLFPDLDPNKNHINLIYQIWVDQIIKMSAQEGCLGGSCPVCDFAHENDKVHHFAFLYGALSFTNIIAYVVMVAVLLFDE